MPSRGGAGKRGSLDPAETKSPTTSSPRTAKADPRKSPASFQVETEVGSLATAQEPFLKEQKEKTKERPTQKRKNQRKIARHTTQKKTTHYKKNKKTNKDTFKFKR